MLKTTDEMRRTGRTGWANGRTGVQADEGSERTSGQVGGRAHKRTRAPGGRADNRTSGRVGERGGRWRTDFRRVKLLN